MKQCYSFNYKNFTAFGSPKIVLLLLWMVWFGTASAQVSNYSFAASAGTYTALSSPTNVFASGWDDNTAVSVPLGFTFTFNGVTYTSVYVHTNGYITFGTSTSGYTPISGTSTVAGVVSAWGRDLQAQNTAPLGSIDYLSSGGVFTVQWSYTRRYYGTNTNAESFEMQIQLYQTTNAIKIVYGSWSNAVSATTSNLGEVGLRGATNADFKNLEVLSSGSWASPTAGAANNVTCYYNELTVATKPASGQTYTFTPPAPCATPANQPTSLVFTPSAGIISATFTAAASTPTNYLVVRTSTATPPAAPVDGTLYTVGASVLGGVIVANPSTPSFTAIGLTPSTPYFFWVYSYNNAGCSGGPKYLASAPLSGTASTTACAGPSGTILVGPTGTYTTLTAAIAALSSGSSGPVIFELQPAYTSAGETYPITFPSNTCINSTNTLTIRPQTGAAGLVITSANTTATLDFNGATYITIDGRPGGTGTTSQLTIANTALGSASAIRFINDAMNNTVTYCSVQGSNTTSLGVISFVGGIINGNDNNVITNNNIGPAGSNLPLNGIYSLGTSSPVNNSNNTISGNNIFDYFSAASATNGINVNSFNSNWTITNNRLYQTANRIYTTASTHTGISVLSGESYTITGNVIGYANASGTGTTNIIGNSAALTGTFPSSYTVSGTANATRYVGINCAFNAGGVVSSIQNNTIAGFALYTSSSATTTTGVFCGIAVTSGNANIGTVTGNTIGSTTGTGSIYTCTTTTGGSIVGISAVSTNGIAIRNNTIGALDAMGTTSSISGGIIGIYTSGPSTSYDVSGNTIGNSTNPNLRMGNLNTGTNLSNVGTTFGIATGTGQFNGILSAQTGAGTIGTALLPNTITNASLNSSSTSASIRGITASGSPAISSNLINNLTSQTTNVSVSSTLLAGMGIFLNSISTNGAVVTKNNINTLSLANTTATGTNLAGIAVYAGTTEISGNKIYNLTNASTSTTTTTPGTASAIFLRQPAGIQSIFNNMFSLGNGQTTNTAFNGIWLQSSAVAYTLNFYHNSVNIEGTVATGTQPSFCLNRSSYTTTAITIAVDVRNNIFTNTRSGGTGKHYIFGNCYGTTAVATGWGANATNYNVLNANAATIGYWTSDQTFASWKTTTACDGNSFSGIPVTYTNTATGDLHLNMGTSPTQMESACTAIAAVSVDYDNQVRPGPAGSVNGGACSPDLGADEFDGVMLDILGPAITYTPLGNTACLVPANRVLSNVTMTDCSNINATTGTKPRIYFKKSGDANTYAGNTSAFNGWKYTEASGTTSPFSFTIDYSLLQAPVVVGDVIQYFVVAQDMSAIPNVSINNGVFAATPASVALTATAFPLTGTINSFMVVSGLSGNVTIGAAGTYPNLTDVAGLFNAINTQGLTGNLTVTLIDPTITETGTVGLNTVSASSCSGGPYTILIKPQTGLAVTLTGTNANALIKLNGADFVTIDGVNTGGTSLTITNTNAAGLTVIWLGSASTTDGATNNTIKNCIISGISTTGTVGCIISGSGATLGSPAEAPNSNNTITGNTLNTAQNGLYLSGQTSSFDQNWLIDGNTIGSNVAANKMSFRGMSIQGVNNFTISNNTIAGVVTSSSSTTTGITTFVNCTNGNIFNNRISDIKNTSTLGFGSNGIGLSCTSTASNITVYNNFVSDVASYGYSSGYGQADNGYGIILISGGGYNIYHNTVLLNTDQTVSGNPAALNVTSGITTAGSLNIRDNIFANIQTVGTARYAMMSSASAVVFGDINYNDYYAGTSPSLGYFSGAVADLAAWRTASGKDLQSKSVAPVFVASVAPADLHLVNTLGTNWCLNGTGVSIPVALDIDGQARSIPPDMGADEFTAVDNSTATPLTQTICSGSAITAITVTGSASAYNWTRDNTVLVTGIAASGTGNISGILTNTTTAPVTVTFTIVPTNANGCGFIPNLTATVIVNPIPTAVPSPSSQTICTGTTANLTLSGSVPGSIFNWTRDNTSSVTGLPASGSGNISSVLTNTTNAPVTVTFTITPSFTNAGTTCTGIPVTATITVNPNNSIALTSAAGTNVQNVCINTAMTTITYSTAIATGATFTGLPAGVTGTWASNVVTISGTVTTLGTFNYTVTLTGGCGTATATGTITVTPDAAIALTSAAGTNVQAKCVNQAFTNITYSVSGGGTGAGVTGLPAGVTGTFAAGVFAISGTPTAAGVFNYTVTTTGTCVQATATGTLTVYALPIPTITGPATPLAGSTGNVYTTEPGMTNYIWTVSAGGTVTGGGTTGSNTVTVTWNTASPQTVTVTYTNGNGCTSAAPTVYFINNALPGPAGPITGSSSVCAGQSGVSYSVGLITSATGYAWTLPTGATIATGANTNVITVNFAESAVSGNITVYGTNGTGNGAVSPAFAVTVNPRPAPSITGPANTCINVAGNVYTTQAGMTGYVWTVSAGGTITAGAGTNAITVTWSTLGAKTVSVNYINSNGCTAIAATVYNVTVNALPVPTITGPASTCLNVAGNVYTTQAGMTGYTWALSAGGVITAGAGTNAITVTWNTLGAQTVSVSYINSNGCTAVSPTVFNVTVNALPASPTLTGPTTACFGSTGNIYSTTTTGTAYNWTVPGGTITAGAGTNSITVTWTTAGAQTVTLNVSNANGCFAATPAVFTTTVGPQITVNAVTSQVVCNGSPTTAVAFNGPVSGSVFSWTNNTPSIGLAGSGTGNIASFNAVNATGAPVTATVTVTPAVLGASTQTVTGALAAGDATIAGGRLFRDGVPSTCAVPKAYPGTSGAGPFYYDTYNFTNTTGSSQCVSVTYTATGTGNAFVTAYSGSFNSASLGTNYIADGGSSSVGPAGAAVTFSFTLANGATVVLVVNEATTSEACTGYSVSVTGLPVIGCTGTPSTFTYTVNPTPVVNPVSNQNVCKGASTSPITFGSNVAGTTFSWTNSNPAIGLAASGTGNIPSFVGTNTGTTPITGTITVTPSPFTNASVTCTGAPLTFQITVHPIPVPTLSGPTSLCAGSTGITYTTEAGNSNYSWTISYDGIITSGLNTNTITVNWPTAGSRYVAVNYTNSGGCGAAAPTYRNVTVLTVPVPMIFGETAVCQGATGVTYTTQAGNSNYVWAVSSGGTITSGAGTASIKVTWSAGGNQTVSVNYTNAGGCSAVQPTVYNVAVAPLPAAGGTITGPASVCAGSQGVSYTVPAIANATTYSWTVPTGATIASGATTNSITVNFDATAVSGIIKVNGVNTCGNGASSPNFSVTVNPIPATPVITKTGSVLSSSAATGNQWYRNGVLIAGATAQQFTPVYLGTYTVIVTVGGCSSAVSNAIVITAIVGTPDLEVSHSFDVYPNPSRGQFNVKVVSGKPVVLSIEIYNNLGAIQWKQENVHIDGTYITPIDLGTVPAGVYMVALRNSELNLVRKIVIMN